MIDIAYLRTLILKNIKSLVVFVILCTIVGAFTSLLLPKIYKSSSTLVPANPKLNDKNYVFGENTLELNGTFGQEVDADRLLTQLRLSSNFSKLVDSFDLVKHYKIKNNEKAKANAQEQLVQNSSIVKNETGAIVVAIWDKNKETAAAMANALVQIAETKSMQASKQVQTQYIAALQSSIDNINKETVPNASMIALKEKNIAALAALQLTANANLPTMVILEKAYASSKADRPKLKFWLLASFFGSLIFSLLSIIILDRFKK